MISTLIENIPYGVLAGFLTLFLALSLSPIARAIGLLDQPGGRKQHKGNIPLIGGICIFMTFAATFFLASETIPEIRWLVISTSLLLVIGIIDDYFDIRAIYKLLAQAIAAGLMMWQTGLYVDHIAYLPNGTSLQLGAWGYGLTLIGVVGMINAFNMSDGIDGLAGIQALTSSLALGAFIFILGNELIHETYLDIFRGAIFGYLLINLSIITKRKIFLGDAGSMIIGFIVSWMVIYYSQLPADKALPASLAPWLLILPIADTITLIFRRIKKGQSPMRADRKHLHHILLRLGFGPRQSLYAMTLLTVILQIIGFSTYLLLGDIGAYVCFTLFVVAYYYLVTRIWRVSKFIRRLI